MPSLFVTVVQIILMMFRKGAVVILAGQLQLAAAGAFTRLTCGWLAKVIGWMLALIAYKPIAASFYAVAFMLLGDGMCNLVMGLAGHDHAADRDAGVDEVLQLDRRRHRSPAAAAAACSAPPSPPACTARRPCAAWAATAPPTTPAGCPTHGPADRPETHPRGGGGTPPPPPPPSGAASGQSATIAGLGGTGAGRHDGDRRGGSAAAGAASGGATVAAQAAAAEPSARSSTAGPPGRPRRPATPWAEGTDGHEHWRGSPAPTGGGGEAAAWA